jgi:MerR family transcriptional regulator, thiopeptide resistance regulator
VRGVETTTDSSLGYKVGAVAAASGLTVRTLHYYEEIGLLVPPTRSEGGHRLYGAAEVERLYRIGLLRRLGLPLGQIGRALDDPAWNLQAAMAAHLGELEHQMEASTQLHTTLKTLVTAIGGGDSPPTQDLLTLLEEMTMLDTNVQRRIQNLVYADLEGAFEFLSRVFQLGPGELTRDGEGQIVHGEIQAGDGVIWLHPERPEFQLASPRTLGGSTSCMVVIVDDVDAHFRHASAQGAVIRYEPVDQDYGYREYGAEDSECGIWSFMKPLG